ncbi:glycosyltransferase family 2 protein [Candidatus Gracilibacteria bacterium]|nr:glycosyltransferase family 2 protein [Candidatus Gracilibacteria bacterium]
MTAPDLSLIIPCYNEAEGIAAMHTRLAAVVPQLRAHSKLELILVDDGSSDNTYQLLQSAFVSWPEVRIVQHERNRGLGQALRTGFVHARGAIVVTCDSDGTYPFSEIPALLGLLRPGVDIVTASPYHPAGGIENVPAYRVWLSKSASQLYRMIVGRGIHTYTAMFRAYRREVIERIPTTADGFLMVTQLLVEAILAGYQVVEYPTVLRVRQYGQSKAKVLRITRSHLAYMRDVLWRRRAGQIARKVDTETQRI